MKRGDVLVVVGAQYGSEGKGNICNFLASRYDIHVRTGGPNAGHSHQAYDRIWKQQVVPCGWVNPDAEVIIGRGALIPLHTLVKEVREICEVDASILQRLHIDAGAGVLGRDHEAEEGGTKGELHQRIGSTGKGVGAARRDRMMRDPSRFAHVADMEGILDDLSDQAGLPHLSACVVEDTPEFLYHEIRAGQSVLVEGTQGCGLSLIHGPWPYVTSADTNAAGFCAEAGIPPHWVTQSLLVARTYPIRVAGASGPLREEIDWDEMQERVDFDLEPERTTVTNKVRRIGEWDERLLRRAIVLNGPTSMAVNFMDYLSPSDRGKTTWDELSEKAHKFVEYVETTFGVPVALVGTGGDTWEVVDRGIDL